MLVGLVAAAILFGWLFPALDPMLFRGWMLMKANTALLLLLSAVSLILSQNQESERTALFGQLIGASVFVLAGVVLMEYLLHISLGLDTLLAPDSGSLQPGRMSPQTATSLCLLGITATLIRVRESTAAKFVDFVVFCLGSFLLVILSGYAFGALQLFGITRSTVTSPQTLFCLALLAFVASGRRSEQGIFSIFVGSGVASTIARAAVPFAILVPFLLEAGRLRFLQTGLFSEEYSVALVTVSAAVLGIGLILTLAWRIETLEQNIRDLSVRDDLTKLYNRRGFLLLAERALQLARRTGTPFSVLFIDLDNLKRVNDTLGHDTGSAFIREVGELLKTCFRESDVIGRIGGDEFVVAGAASEAGIRLAAQRLENAAADRNLPGDREYPLSFSFGHVTSEEDQYVSLEELLNRADAAMYIAKRNKRLTRS